MGRYVRRALTDERTDNLSVEHCRASCPFLGDIRSTEAHGHCGVQIGAGETNAERVCLCSSGGLHGERGTGNRRAADSALGPLDADRAPPLAPSWVSDRR